MSGSESGYRFDILDSIESRNATTDASGANPERTICDVHRDAFLIARDELPPGQAKRIMELMAEAFDMGKRMSNKMFKYNNAGFAARGLKRS